MSQSHPFYTRHLFVLCCVGRLSIDLERDTLSEYLSSSVCEGEGGGGGGGGG